MLIIANGITFPDEEPFIIYFLRYLVVTRQISYSFQVFLRHSDNLNKGNQKVKKRIGLFF